MGFVDNARTRLWGALDMRRDFEADRARFGVQASWKDFLRAREQTLCTTREYFLFHFYERSDAERDTFLTTQRRDDLIHAIGDDETINALRSRQQAPVQRAVWRIPLPRMAQPHTVPTRLLSIFSAATAG